MSDSQTETKKYYTMNSTDFDLIWTHIHVEGPYTQKISDPFDEEKIVAETQSEN